MSHLSSHLSSLLKTNLVSKPIDLSGLLEAQKKHTSDLINGIELNGFVCDFSGTGCGKTYIACAIARHMAKTHSSSVYVIAPKCVIPAWKKILGIMGVNATVLNYEKVARGNLVNVAVKTQMQDIRTKTKVVKDMIQLTLPENSFIVFDESHKCKGFKSSNSELLLSAYTQKEKYKFMTVSATQALNPMDMFVYGYIIGEHNFMEDAGNFYQWGKQFGGDWAETRDGFKIDTKSDVSRARMKKLHDRLFNMGLARRLTAEDFRDSFADNHIMPEIFDMGSNGAKIDHIFQEMNREIEILMKKNYSAHIFAVITKARRQAELLKAPTIVEQILRHRDEGKSVAVFVNYTDTLEAIVKRVENELGKNSCAVVRGGQKDKDRQANIDDFQDNKVFVIVCNMAAGGVGISLHDVHGGHERVSIISPSYSGIQLIQALGRIHRAEGKSKCMQYIVYCAGTIEEQIAVKVGGKLGNLDALNDGDMMGKDYGLPLEVREKINDDYFDELVEEELDLDCVSAS